MSEKLKIYEKAGIVEMLKSLWIVVLGFFSLLFNGEVQDARKMLNLEHPILRTSQLRSH